MGRLLDAGRVFKDKDGAIAAAGTAFFYTTGTTTLKNIFSDAALTVQNANPLTLGSDGRLPAEVFGFGSYTVRVNDVNGALAWTEDDVQPNTGTAETAVTFTSADATPTVGAGYTFITAGTTAITDFDDGFVGQTIKILGASTLVITDGSPIALRRLVDFVMVAGDTLTLHMFNDQVWEEIARSDTSTTVTFTSTDATPTVLAGISFITAGTTAITDFDNGVVGQTIHILAASSITITEDGDPIALKNGENFVMVDGDTLTLHMFVDQIWEEIGRSESAVRAEVVTATNVITSSENGKTFYLGATGGFVSTLPAPAIGLNYKFIVNTAPSGGTYTVVTAASANIMNVFILDIVGELVYATGRDVVTFTDGTLVGAMLECEADGVSWHCKAFAGADGDITTGQT